jgi:hypothetical protein
MHAEASDADEHGDHDAAASDAACSTDSRCQEGEHEYYAVVRVNRQEIVFVLQHPCTLSPTASFKTLALFWSSVLLLEVVRSFLNTVESTSMYAYIASCDFFFRLIVKPATLLIKINETHDYRRGRKSPVPDRLKGGGMGKKN